MISQPVSEPLTSEIGLLLQIGRNVRDLRLWKYVEVNKLCTFVSH